MAASLLGTFGAAEANSNTVTSGSRTTTAGSLVCAHCAKWNATNNALSTATDNKSNTFTNQVEIGFSGGAGDFPKINLCWNLAGTRGATHTVTHTEASTASDHTSIGGSEWDGIAASPAVSSTTNTGTSATPSVTLTPGATSLMVAGMGYGGAASTFAVTGPTLAVIEIDENSDQQDQCVGYKASASGSTTLNFTIAASRLWGALVVAFEEAGGGGGTSIVPIVDRQYRQRRG